VQKIIEKKVSDIVLTLRAEDYLTLPPRVDHTVPVVLPPEARGHYRDLEKTFLIKINDSEITALFAAAQVNKMLQLANGHVYDEEREAHLVHDAKLEALGALVERAPGPVLVATSFRADQERILRVFPEARLLDRSGSVIDAWNSGEVPILVAHPASAGHGLNLQHGGQIVVWFGLTWSLELYQQFNARLHRQGQTKPVQIYHLVAEDTADETVMRAIQAKNTTQSALLNALKLDLNTRTEVTV